MIRRKGEYEVIYGGSSKRFSDPTERYEDIYDEDGDAVICDLCGGEMKWNDNECVCPECGQRMDRETFFNYIGAEPPGPECTGCENIYPGCVICPYGYVEDEE